MPANRNALIRFKTIDKCLRNRQRKWTLEKLVDAVSDALYEYEGIAKGISRRTVQADIQMMRSDKLGYNAPIIVKDKKYYTYEDAAYSIINIPISEQDLGRMNEAIEVLKQFKGFSHFSSLNDVVHKLEDYAYSATNNIQPVIDFEKNEQLKGLEHLDVIYKAVINRKKLMMTYQSFNAREPLSFAYSVWWLKEFKNRWFAVGVKDKKRTIFTLALDRIQQVEVMDGEDYTDSHGLTPEMFYKDVIGVTVAEAQRPMHVKLLVNKENAPYVETKPLHHTQQVIERNDKGIIISLRVKMNYELEKELLGFGEGLCVLQPLQLQKRMYHRVRSTLACYDAVIEDGPDE